MGRIVRAAPQPGLEAAATLTQPPDDYKDRVVKYIPTETVAAYLAILKILQAENTEECPVKITQFIVVVIMAIATFYYFSRIAEPSATKEERKNHAFVSLTAFLVWALVLGGPLFSKDFPGYIPPIALILFSLVSGFIVPRPKTASEPSPSPIPPEPDPLKLESFGGEVLLETSRDEKVRQACVSRYEANKGDCSAFVRAVAGDLGISLTGNADEIVDKIRGADWSIVADGRAAKDAAESGLFVLVGLKGADHHQPRAHGHVAVIVGGGLAHGKYPTGYWGSLGGNPGANKTINWAWTEDDRDSVLYRSRVI